MKLDFSTSSLFLTSILILFSLTQGFAQSSWKSPDYKKENYRKVVVLAKTSNPGAKRLLEDQTVAELQANGIQAIPAYSNITERDLASENALIAKAEISWRQMLFWFITSILSLPSIKTVLQSMPILEFPLKSGFSEGF